MDLKLGMYSVTWRNEGVYWIEGRQYEKLLTELRTKHRSPIDWN